MKGTVFFSALFNPTTKIVLSAKMSTIVGRIYVGNLVQSNLVSLHYTNLVYGLTNLLTFLTSSNLFLSNGDDFQGSATGRNTVERTSRQIRSCLLHKPIGKTRIGYPRPW